MSANGLIPALGNVDLPSLTVSRSTNGPLLDGEVVVVIAVEAARLRSGFDHIIYFVVDFHSILNCLPIDYCVCVDVGVSVSIGVQIRVSIGVQIVSSVFVCVGVSVSVRISIGVIVGVCVSGYSWMSGWCHLGCCCRILFLRPQRSRTVRRTSRGRYIIKCHMTCT